MYKWMNYKYHHQWKEKYTCGTDVEIISVSDGKVIGVAQLVEFRSSLRGPAPIYVMGPSEVRESFVNVTEGGRLFNIKWKESSGPSRAYYNGCGWHIDHVRLKWRDGETEFNIRTVLSMLEKNKEIDYTKATFSTKIASSLEERREEKGFEIKCKDCKSTNCEIESDYWDNADGSYELFGYTIHCRDCGQSE